MEIPGRLAASIILAGGKGTRLFPLTHNRCKPDVAFGGRYRLVNIPISNSINSGIEQIFVFNSPKLVSIVKKQSSKVRRSKLYYIRNLRGKATNLKVKL